VQDLKDFFAIRQRVPKRTIIPSSGRDHIEIKDFEVTLESECHLKCQDRVEPKRCEK
jgi:hypothetical protein